jgi:hypothetical protein
MRLWFCDRALVLVSESINLHQVRVALSQHSIDFNNFTEKDRRSVIALIVALESASRTALGYDPTIKRVWQVDSKATYRIQVPVEGKPREGCAPKFRLFQTEDLLSDAGAEAFRGRGTRVWKVREVVDGKPTGPPMVLKDSFVNEDRPREGETTKKIVGSLPAGDRRRLHFLTVVVHGDVVIDDHPDSTDAIHHGIHCPSGLPCINVAAIVYQGLADQSYVVSPSNTPSTHGSGSLAFVLPTAPGFDPSSSYQNRQHYRIVFKEVGETVSNMKNRKDMFLAIRGALNGEYVFLFLLGECLVLIGFIATEAMHELGYVHRDISAGNVLLVDPEESPSGALKRGVLADLEYAVELVTRLPHAVRTGTPFFMAPEVEAQAYLAFNWAVLDANWKSPPFYYNRLHGLLFIFVHCPLMRFHQIAIADIESFWWLCIWCVTYFCGKDERPTDQQLQVITRTLFPIPHNFGVRFLALQGFIYNIESLPEPQALAALGH